MSVKYRRVLIKISGEALSGGKGSGFDFDFVTSVCESVKEALARGAEVGIVIGGGNFWRGVKDGAGKVERVSADRMGMLATAMNCLAVADVFRQCGVDARVMTAVDIQGVGERHDVRKAIEYLESGKVVLFACGTGHPFFSTDTASVLRAAEIGADAILLAKNIDGVYSADPRKDQLYGSAEPPSAGDGFHRHQPCDGQQPSGRRFRPGGSEEYSPGSLRRKDRDLRLLKYINNNIILLSLLRRNERCLTTPNSKTK